VFTGTLRTYRSIASSTGTTGFIGVTITVNSKVIVGLVFLTRLEARWFTGSYQNHAIQLLNRRFMLCRLQTSNTAKIQEMTEFDAIM
jgi:hypothetical protein